jgi:hypothetical protein
VNTLGLYRFLGGVGHDVNVGVVETFDPGYETIVNWTPREYASGRSYAPVIVD